MICSKCKSNQATTHIKSVINGEYTDIWLCPHCAKELGYSSFLNDAAADFSSFLGSFLGDGLPSRTSATRCRCCGSSFADIARSGKVGCAGCYDEFYDELLPSIRKMHGNIEHKGKAALQASNEYKTKGRIEKAQAELDKAIKEQNFELAAKLRDEIKALKEEKENER